MKERDLRDFLSSCLISQVALVVKSPPTSVGDIRDAVFDPWVGKIPLEEGMATHSCILAWRIPWTEEPVGSCPKGCKELDLTEAT